MNNPNDIEKIFKKLDHHADEAPTHLWPVIEEILHKPSPKNRRPLFGLLLVIGLGLVLALAPFASSNQDNPKPADTPNFEYNPKEQILSAPIQPPLANIPVDKGEILPKKQSANTPIISSQNTNNEFAPSHQPTKRTVFPSHQIVETKLALVEEQQSHPVLPRQNTRVQNKSIPTISKIDYFPEGIHTEQLSDYMSKYVIEPDNECAGTRVIKVPKSLSLYAHTGATFLTKFSKARSDEYDAFKNQVDSAEVGLPGYRFGLALGYQNSTGLLIRGGVNIQHLRERFEFSGDIEERTVITKVYDNEGNVIGQDTSIQIGRHTVNSNNQYSTIEFPLNIGYVSQKEKTQIGLHLGTVLSLNSTLKGQYLDQNNQVASYSDKSKYDTNFGISFFGSIGMTYFLSENWGIYVEPEIRIYPKAISLSEFPLEERISTISLSAGMKYNF